MSGNIPRSFIDELLTRVDIVDVVDSRITLKKAGKDYQACCPFHSEKTPSFTVSRQKQFYYCFGCGASGSAIRFLMDYDHMSFVEAVDHLARQAGLVVPFEDRQTPRKNEVSTTKYYELLEKAARYYQYQLRHHAASQQAIDYLKQRGLTGETAKRFELGYAPSGWDNILSAFSADEQTRKDLVELGMLIQKDNGQVYDRFRQRIMFPIRDRRGRVIAFGGRVLSAEDTPKYLNSPETPVFHKNKELYGLYNVLKDGESQGVVIVVEGYMDVVALAQAGISNAVATLGTAISESHIQTLVKHFNKVIFCFDGDAAGRKAALRALDTSLPQLDKGVEFQFMFLPEGEDPDSIVKSAGASAFNERLLESIPLSEFLISELLAKADYRTLDGRARLADIAKAYLQKIPAGSYLQLISNELSKYTELSGVNRVAQNKFRKQKAHQGADREDRPSTIGLAVAMLLEEPSLANLVADPEKFKELNVPGVKFLIDLLVFIRMRPNITTGGILEYWHNSKEGNYLYKILSWEHHVPESGFETEFVGSIRLLEKQLLEQELNSLLQRSKRGVLDSAEKKRMNDLIGLCQGVVH